MATAYITHPACLEHNMGYEHPESPARITAIQDQLAATGILSHLQQHEAPRATFEQLVRVHPAHYIHGVEAAAPKRGLINLDPDTLMNPYTLEAVYRAAGAVVLATDLVMQGEVNNAFCNVRPPGHHATPEEAMGFCFFNNVAVGAAHALAQYSLERVAIVDFDVHHGNGTEAVFKDETRVLFCSTFQHPFYPYSGADSGNEHIINVPLAAQTDGTAFRAAVNEHWLPALEVFQPEIIFISAGFDAHREDQMARLNLVEADYVWVTEQIMTIAARYAQNRVISVLEGGYALTALARSAAAHVGVLSGYS